MDHVEYLKIFHYMSQRMRLWYLSHRHSVKAQTSLRIRTVSPEPSLFAHMKYGSRWSVWPKTRHLASLDGCACVFEEWVYGGRKVAKSRELAYMTDCFMYASKLRPTHLVMHSRKMYSSAGQEKVHTSFNCQYLSYVCKNPKNSEIRKICCNHPKICTW